MAGTSAVSFTDEEGIEYGLWSTPDYLTGSPHGVGMLVGVVARSNDGKAGSRIFPGLESGGVACLSFSSRLRKTAANQDTVVFISSVIDTASFDGRPGSVVIVCKLPNGQQHPPGMRPKVVVKPAECGDETELSIQSLSPGAAARVKAALEKPGPWFPSGLTECCRTTSDST